MRIDPSMLIAGYCQGIFPMAHEAGSTNISWYDPDPRAIIPLDTFHIPRRLARIVRSGRFEIRFDYDFRLVMQMCANPSRKGAWISPEMIEAYTTLHKMGFAHSVETWRNGKLVGGLYGVAIHGLFAGESMFSLESDASKVALVYLVQRLRSGGYILLDTQFMTNHLAQFGTIEISRDAYKQRLAAALDVDAQFL